MLYLKEIIKKYISSKADVQLIMNVFNQYYEKLISYNEKINLTAITDKEEVEINHFIDSLAGIDYIKGDCIDIGTGAGFPSLPLAIMNKDGDKNFLLVDSLKKRTVFLEELINETGLKNASVIHLRVEDLSKKKLYDTAVSRAVAPLNVLCELCLPFIKKGGIMIAYKSVKAEEEIKLSENALKILGGRVKEIIDYKLPLEQEKIRKLILIEKIAETPEKYPRGQNKPRLNPL